MEFLLPTCITETCSECELCHVRVAGTLQLVKASMVVLPVIIL